MAIQSSPSRPSTILWKWQAGQVRRYKFLIEDRTKSILANRTYAEDVIAYEQIWRLEAKSVNPRGVTTLVCNLESTKIASFERSRRDMATYSSSENAAQWATLNHEYITSRQSLLDAKFILKMSSAGEFTSEDLSLEISAEEAKKLTRVYGNELCMEDLPNGKKKIIGVSGGRRPFVVNASNLVLSASVTSPLMAQSFSSLFGGFIPPKSESAWTTSFEMESGFWGSRAATAEHQFSAIQLNNFPGDPHVCKIEYNLTIAIKDRSGSAPSSKPATAASLPTKDRPPEVVESAASTPRANRVGSGNGKLIFSPTLGQLIQRNDSFESTEGSWLGYTVNRITISLDLL